MIVLAGCMIIARHHRLQRHTASILRNQIERIENRLSPGRAVLLGHNRRDDIDELCQARNLHAVRVLQELDECQCIHDGVFIIIDVLQKMRMRSPGKILHILVVLLRGVIPDVPLVKGQVDVLLAVLRRLYIVTGCNDRIQEIFQIICYCEELWSVVILIAPVLMQRNIVHIVIGLIQNSGLPLSKGRHHDIGGPADNRLNGVVHGLHGFGGFCRKMTVFQCLLVAHLPRSVHLIAHAPELDAVRVLVAMLASKIRIVGIRVQVTILQKI